MSIEVGQIENDPVTGVDAQSTQAAKALGSATKKLATDTIEDEERAAEEVRFQEQCFLLRAITNPILGKHLKNPTQAYSNFIKVRSNDPTVVMNNLTATRGADELLTINQKEIALLQPMIRIFKVREDNNNTIESEYRFDEGSFVTKGEGHPTTSFFADRASRGADVGLESVSFEWMGTQPAEVNNNIRCTVKLFFQNMEALTKKRLDESGREYSYSDLILRPPGLKDVNWYKPEHYRIKLIVGWAKPPEYNTGVIRPDVADALVRTRTVLNLTLKNHTFDFKMDGTSTLEIEYHAWAEGALSSPATDLFYPSDADAKKLKQLEAAEDYSKTQKKMVQQNSPKKAPVEGDGDLPEPQDPPEATDREKGIDENLEKLREAKTELQNSIRANAYSRFLDALLYSTSSNIYYIDVTAQQLGKAKSDDDATDQAQKKRVDAKGKKSKCSDLVMDTNINGGLLSPNVRQGLSAGKVKPGEALNSDAKDNIKEAIGETKAGDLRGEGYGDSAEDYAKATLGYLKPGLSPKDNGALRVNFFYFGDLLDVALGILHGPPKMGPNVNPQQFGQNFAKAMRFGIIGSSEFKNSPASKVDIMTGPLYLTNPCTNELIPMNLADVPISVNLFTQWFMNNVIRRQAPTYLLRKFIDDLIGTLLPAALGEGCVDNAGRTLLRMQSNVLNIKGVNNAPPFKRGQTVNAKEVAEVVGAMDWSGQVQQKNTYDYLFLYAVGFSPNHLGGDKEMDRKNGIYHFKLGADEGILKSVSFDKADAPYLGEMKVTGKNNIANDLGGGGIYNAKMELVGNSLFVPGQYIYVDPSALGIGNPAADGTDGIETSIAHRLRLGGYYFVHKVESTLERGNFTTSIEAKFESGGGKSEAPPPTAREQLDSKLTEEARAGFEQADIGRDEYSNPEENVSGLFGWGSGIGL